MRNRPWQGLCLVVWSDSSSRFAFGRRQFAYGLSVLILSTITFTRETHDPKSESAESFGPRNFPKPWEPSSLCRFLAARLARRFAGGLGAAQHGNLEALPVAHGCSEYSASV